MTAFWLFIKHEIKINNKTTFRQQLEEQIIRNEQKNKYIYIYHDTLTK